MREIRTRPPPIPCGINNIFRTCAESVQDPLPYHVDSKSKDARISIYWSSPRSSPDRLEWGAPGLAQPSQKKATFTVWEGLLCWVGVFSVPEDLPLAHRHGGPGVGTGQMSGFPVVGFFARSFLAAPTLSPPGCATPLRTSLVWYSRV